MTETPSGLEPSANVFGADFKIRLIAGSALAVAAVIATMLGGVWFAVFWGVAFAAVAYEWQKILPHPRKFLRIPLAIATAVGAVILCSYVGALSALMLAVAAAFAVAWLGTQEDNKPSFFCGIGVLYATLPVIVLVWIEWAGDYALATIVFVFAIVWSADIGAYLSGRLIGGPRLWPRISPKKTWSGFLGGTLAGTIIPLLAIAFFGIFPSGWLVFIAMLLSIVSAAGDLFESAFKRRFDVKDSSRLIPGHGGVMDRLDGFVAVLMFLGFIAALTGRPPTMVLFGP
jgi:phosphatidate cytidylyltransferase